MLLKDESIGKIPEVREDNKTTKSILLENVVKMLDGLVTIIWSNTH